jgi:signal transduction histidine kinase
VRRGWSRLGLRGRLALSIAAILIASFAFVFVAVRREMSDERGVISREEGREAGAPSLTDGDEQAARVGPIGDAQSEVERTFIVAGGIALGAALLAAYLLATRTAAPLRRMADTAAAVEAGDLTPRIGGEPTAPVEARVLAESFDSMLDRLDDAFSRQRRFASDASHELRTPLTAIRGQLELLGRQERPEPQEVRRVEEVALREMARIERLVDDLLLLARLDERAPLARRRLSVRALLEGVVAAQPGPAVRLSSAADGTVDLDPERITQVLRNLIDNARRHAGREGRVEISASAEDGLLTIRVDDDGPGVPQEERERVFDRFHRGDPSRGRSSGGSGLGLPICRSIVAAHGGEIWIGDSPLGGARVAVRLGGFQPQPGTA